MKKIRVKDTNICNKCYYGGEFSTGCTYILIENQSRLIENGVRYDPAYCTKFIEGTKAQGEMLKSVQKRKKGWKNG